MKYRILEINLKNTTPYSSNADITEKKEPKETNEEFEKRTWRSKAHTDSDDFWIIPGMQFKAAIREAAKYDSKKIPGKGKETYSKHIKSGIRVMSYINLGIKKNELIIGKTAYREICYNPGSKAGRVVKIFPYIEKWNGKITISIFDYILPDDIILEYVNTAGSFIGVGRRRPATGGEWGMWEVLDHKMTEIS